MLKIISFAKNQNSKMNIIVTFILQLIANTNRNSGDNR